MIEKNAQKVIGLQQGHGGWNELMKPVSKINSMFEHL